MLRGPLTIFRNSCSGKLLTRHAHRRQHLSVKPAAERARSIGAGTVSGPRCFATAASWNATRDSPSIGSRYLSHIFSRWLLTLLIQTWNGAAWATGSLRELGLRIHLGHGRGGRCPNPIYNVRYTIVNTRGTHDVGMCFCNCKQNPPHPHDQLRAAGLLSIQADMAMAIDSGAVIVRGSRQPNHYTITRRVEETEDEINPSVEGAEATT